MTRAILAEVLALNRKLNREFGLQPLSHRVSSIMRRLNIGLMNWNYWLLFGLANTSVLICWVRVSKC